MPAVAVVPIIETSAVMQSSGFVSAATIGVQAFIDDLLTNDAIAVASFDAQGLVDYPSTNALAVVDSTLSQLTAADAAVQALTFTGTTVNIGAGLQTAYGLFSTAPSGASPGALLMSSGQQSAGGTDPLTLASYVPTSVCAPGPTANLSLLNQIATISRGTYYYMPAASDMQTVLNQIRGARAGWTTVINIAKPVAPIGFWLQPATLASNLAQAQISVVWENAALTYTSSSNPAANQISVTLVAPPGITLQTPPTLSGGGYCTWNLSSPISPGQWYVQIMYPGPTALPVTIGVFAAPNSQAPALALKATAPPVAGQPAQFEAWIENAPGALDVHSATVEIISPRTSLAGMARVYAELVEQVAQAASLDPTRDLAACLNLVRKTLLPNGDIFAHQRRCAPVVFDHRNRASFVATPSLVAGSLSCRMHVKGAFEHETFEQTRLISLHVPD